MVGANAHETAARAFADRFAPRAGAQIDSIVYFPYPFSGGQLLVACKDSVPYLHELVAIAAHLDPPGIPMHWLRVSELGLLRLPQPGAPFVFYWWATGGYPAWPYWLRHRGSVLWGDDILGRTPIPEDPRRLLDASLWGNLTWNRNHLFLRLLVEGKAAELVDTVGSLARRLMATALLVRGEWEAEEAEIVERFRRGFGTGSDAPLCNELAAAFGQRPQPDTGGPGSDDLERSAREAVWLVESLARMLRRYAA